MVSTEHVEGGAEVVFSCWWSSLYGQVAYSESDSAVGLRTYPPPFPFPRSVCALKETFPVCPSVNRRTPPLEEEFPLLRVEQ